MSCSSPDFAAASQPELQRIYQDLLTGRLSKQQALEAIRVRKAALPASAFLAVPAWEAQAAGPNTIELAERHVVVYGFDNLDTADIRGTRCERLQADVNSYEECAAAAFKNIQAILQSRPQGQVLLQVVVEDTPESSLLIGLSGLLKTAALENPQFRGQIILLDPQVTAAELGRQLDLDAGRPQDTAIRYRQGARQVQQWRPAQLNGTPRIAFKEQGIYLITGGRGALGTVFAREILEKSWQARVILTGRAQVTGRQQDRVEYRQLDLADPQAVCALVAQIVKEYGQLNGVLHCAGTTIDNFIVRKSPAEFAAVLTPKVAGTVNLDRATRDINLDFLALFSSIAGATGNVGQADYAAANGFMDGFAGYRNQKVAAHERYGLTVSINWPLWEAGGMQIDPASWSNLQEVTGAVPLSTGTGLQAFYQSLCLPEGRSLVMAGNTEKIEKWLAMCPTSGPARGDREPEVSSATGLRDVAERHLCKQLATVLKLSPDRIDPRSPLESFGIDSILAMQLIGELEKTFGSLPKTLFFEYQSIEELTEYFVRSHASRLAALCSAGAGCTAQTESGGQLESRRRIRQFPARRLNNRERPAPQTAHEPIAIIGLSGRYPLARTLDEYWTNLREGRDCIVEVPSSRWNWREYYNEDRSAEGHHYSKWGGFIDGVDEFDPLFFNIPPRDAKLIDPQERLFLQHAWMAMEDAGYTRATLQPPGDDSAGDVGVYVGVMYSEYQMFGVEASTRGQRTGLLGSLASIANRVSFCLNLQGPSIALDTMCSSSLTAIHLACQDLRSGRTRMAIAGGVNVTVHPNKYLVLSAGQFISSEGQCQSFGEGGDGYIPAEGVGAVLLKPYGAALRDGDHIYGLIRGSALSHGGRTNGFTVPNPRAQARVIKRALKEADVEPLQIGYIETHGTGTKLGDPIEVAALTAVFDGYASSNARCPIGSVKSNIGHAESAAGVAALTKVLLQMKHRQIVPSLHSARLNPNIDFANSPFEVNQTLKPWEQPLVEGALRPRIAGISSFGAGGANAHVIVEEYRESAEASASLPVDRDHPAAIVLSARTDEQLKAKARDLLAFVRAMEASDIGCLAYTLQVGREAMEERLAVQVNSAAELIQKLRAYVSGESDVDGVHRGKAKQNREVLSLFNGDADLQEVVGKWVARRNLPRLLELWVKGLNVDWQPLYAGLQPRRMSLPSYPFARERHWFETAASVSESTSRWTTTSLSTPVPATTAPLETQQPIALSDAIFGQLEQSMGGPEIYDYGAGVFAVVGATADTLVHTLDELQKNPSTRVVVVSGTDDGFLVGGAEARYELSRTIASFPYPLVATLPGGAAGVDFLMAALCDFLICAEEGSYHYGRPTDIAVLEERFGEARAHEFLSLCAPVSGAYLRDRGWTCTFVPRDQVQAHAQQLANDLAAKPRESLGLLKRHLKRLLLPRLAPSIVPTVQVGSAHPAIESSRWFQSEDRGAVGIITLQPGSGSSDLRDLLRDLAAAVAHSGQNYQALVLSSAHPGFLPALDDRDLEEGVLEFQQAVSSCGIPVVAALKSDAYGLAWLLAQCCDQCIHNETGRYSFDYIWSRPQLGSLVATIFAHRFGDHLGREILLTGSSYCGSELGKRALVEQGDVLAAAVNLATRWSEMPRDHWISLKQRTSRLVQDSLAATADSITENNSTVVQPVVPDRVALSSNVVSATAYPEGILVVRMEDHQAKNMFSAELMAGIDEVFAHVANTPSYKVVVLTGYGNYFAAGGTQETLRAIQQGSAQFTDRRSYESPLQASIPVIAAMQGHGIGAGWVLGMNADLTLFSEEARYVSPYMEYGFTPGAGSTLLFPRKVGYDLACESLLTARQYSGRELQQRGMEFPVLAQDQVFETALEVARRIAKRPRSVLVGLKHRFSHSLRQQLEETYRLELEMHSQTLVNRADTLDLINERFTQKMEDALPASSTGTEAFREGQDGDATAAIIATLQNLLASELQLPGEEIDGDMQFVDLGLDSISGVTWLRKINANYGLSIEATRIYSYPTLKQLSVYVQGELKKVNPSAPAAVATQPARATVKLTAAPVKSTAPAVKLTTAPVKLTLAPPVLPKVPATSPPAAAAPLPTAPAEIAVIGLAGQFPGAKNIDEFWQNIAAGRDCIVPVASERWDPDDFYHPGKPTAGKTNSRWLGALEEYDRFDPLFFNLSPAEAEAMDPQQRLFLQACWNAIEHAGYDARDLSGSQCGVFVGCASGDYHQGSAEQRLSAQGFTGAASSILAARINYLLNLQGPSLAIDTACSSSLVAIAQACDGLRYGTIDLALAGGVYVMAGPEMHIRTAQAGMLSTDGRCFTFDHRANGFVPGEAVGTVVLKRLCDAQRDGDTIYAVVRGWGVNQDGRTNGITAPNPEAQTRLQQQVYGRYGLDPANIQLIEAHGTGTQLGDPIEIQGLKETFAKYTAMQDYCALGSVKSNIGHCLTAAGVTGFIKLVQALRQKQLPPTIHFEELNEHIDLRGSPFYINTQLRDWEYTGAGRRQAAVSSFGFSGTNAHIVLEEYVDAEEARPRDEEVMVPLSARTPEALVQRVRDLLEFIESQRHGVNLADLAYTLQKGRVTMEQRTGFVASSLDQLMAQLRAYLNGDITGHPVADRDLNQVHRHTGRKPKRIGLPGYPFARERYWIGDEPAEQQQGAPHVVSVPLRETTLQKVKQAFGRVIKLQPDRIDAGKELSSYGVDSLMITRLNDEFAKVFGELPKTLFFEYRSLDEVTTYFLETHETRCRSWTGVDKQPVGRAPTKRAKPRIAAANDEQPIAIIGLSGLYPQAATLEQYWANLRGGKDCITEIPARRWALDGFFDSNPMRAVERGRSYCKWGGFIDQFDRFDALFFGISPREAMSLDPQERIFLQAIWHALESAGYTRTDLRDKFQRRVGVFAGITKQGFNLHGSEATRRDEKFYPHTSFSSLANRVSWFLDITGPSMPIDTMCSSSLTAIHEACEHIHRGECALAFAGGVNLYLHPSTYVDMAAQYALSRDGKCRSFGSGASGFVPGEGVGAVLLKPLAAALADNDNIHGLILATHVNHGGKTNGYTVPNPRAQAELIRGALEKSGVSAREISYIEAHGTGTQLGDPIEMEGLQKAFGPDSPEGGYCRVGSAKSNIGHLEAAAGMAGLTKVLLQMKHREIVPSLHATELNPGIRFDGTPFRLNTELTPWEARGADGQPLPLVAGISSFGAGGANAHIIVKEFQRPTASRCVPVAADARVVVPLSAKTPEQLRQVAAALVESLQTTPQDLDALAYTLQVGREALDERLALVVESHDQLMQELRAYSAGEQSAGESYAGRCPSSGKDMSVINQDDDMQEAVSRWLARRKLSKLAELWVSGLNVDWNGLYGDNKPARVNLPVYPFADERYWIPRSERSLQPLEEILEQLETHDLETERAVEMLKVLM